VVAPVVKTVTDPLAPVGGPGAPVITPVTRLVAPDAPTHTPAPTRTPAPTLAPLSALAPPPATPRTIAPIAQRTPSTPGVPTSAPRMGAPRTTAPAPGPAPAITAPVLVPGPTPAVAPAQILTTPARNPSLPAPAARRPAQWLPTPRSAASGVAAFPWSFGPRGVTLTPVTRSTPSVAASAARTPLAPAVPATPTGAGSAPLAGSGIGGWSGGPGALLLTLFAVALCAAYRFLLAPAAYRPAAFVSLVERPG
jgi:hypothetical protein